MRLLLHWMSERGGGLARGSICAGHRVSGVTAALIAALVIGLINATLGLLLKIITFPLTILTLGLFWFVINAIMLELAAAIVPGFYVRGFIPALIGAVALSWSVHRQPTSSKCLRCRKPLDKEELHRRRRNW